VLTALELEARTLARELGLERVPSSPWPHFRGGVLEVTSVGLQASGLASRVARCRAPAVVVSAGVCGALSPALGEGALVVPELVVTARGERFATAPLPTLAASGTLCCTAALVQTASDKTRLWVETGAVAVDLESGPILAWARDVGGAAAVVRAVSDTAGQSVPPELAAAVAADGTLSPSRAVRAALARPAVLGRALSLRRGTASALAAVARALAAVARATAGGA
jgi:adenosylhomocysteine nucleosidase